MPEGPVSADDLYLELRVVAGELRTLTAAVRANTAATEKLTKLQAAALEFAVRRATARPGASRRGAQGVDVADWLRSVVGDLLRS